jgi:hypothetical protein
MHGGLSPGAPKGNKNALKHGRYTAEAIARRREIAELIRQVRQLAAPAELCATNLFRPAMPAWNNEPPKSLQLTRRLKCR